MQLQSRGRTKQSTLQAVDVTKEHSAENISRGNTLISFATQGLKQSLASHSVHATHLHSLGNQSATFRQIGNFGTAPSGPKTFGENILSFSQLSLSLVLGFFRATLKHCTCRHDKTSEHCTCSHDKKLLHSLYTRQNSSVTCAVRTCNAFTATHLHSPSAWTSVQRRPEKQCAQWVHSGRARGRAGKGHSGGGG